ncbi:class D sortase, partial [Patescibacteria group bacterium]|nr:class D sortase [Patescibacteria group bacterium]
DMDKIKKILNSVVLVASTAILLIAVVLVVLNWPAYYKRLSFGFNKHTLASEQSEKLLEVGNQTGSLLEDRYIFPDLFVSTEIKQIRDEYQEKYEYDYLAIPSLGIEAPIKYLDSTDENVLKDKLKEGVGHYPDTAMPGEKGNVFIFGHSSYYWWDSTEFSSIFANLESVKKGDKVLVKYDGELFVYQVVDTLIVEPTEVSVLQQGDNYELSLMTCTPLGTNLRRFVVKTELVG